MISCTKGIFMKVILPVAGKGTRLLPQTQVKPKGLVRVAGQPVLGHLLDRIRDLPIEEIIVIVDADRDNEAQIKTFMEAAAPAPVQYVQQLELRGPAHAVFLARDHIERDVFIIFNDTLFDADLSQVGQAATDGIIWVREVDDPRRFGLVVTQDDRITELVEKPEDPPSNLAMIGMYYMKDGPGLMKRIESVIEADRTVKGEFYLPDPFQMMINEGYNFEAAQVQGWYDCGTVEALLETNCVLLENKHLVSGSHEECVIIPPVNIEAGARLNRSVIGPHVSVSAGAVIQNSIIRDSIINENATVEDALIQHSLIGENSVVKGAYKRLNVGDYSALHDA